MKKTVVVAAAALGLLVLGAAPASAAGNTIDEADALYALDCDTTAWQLYGVDSPTGALTGIGSGTPDEDYGCSYQAAYNPATGVSYYIQARMGSTTLAIIDVVTGVTTPIDEFYYLDVEFPTYPFAEAIAIGGDGAAYILGGGLLYSVDLATADVEPISETIDNVYAFAWDSVTGGFYAVERETNELFQIDVTDGSYVSLGVLAFPDEDVADYFSYSLQFDEAGTAWLSADVYVTEDEFYESALWSFSLTDPALTAVLSGYTTLGDDYTYTESLLIVPGTPEPALAATGTDSAPLLAGALGLLVIGGVAVALRRRAA